MLKCFLKGIGYRPLLKGSVSGKSKNLIIYKQFSTIKINLKTALFIVM